VQVGDEVLVFGRGREGSVPVEEVAVWAETIPYEILCLAGRRMPRRYVRGEGERL